MGLGFSGRYALVAAGLAVQAVGALIPLAGWSALTKALIAYGYAARIPTAIVYYLAMRGNWGTHYDALPPGIPQMGLMTKYLLFGFFPQLILWVAFTVISGSLFGWFAAALFRREKAPAPATS